MVIEKELTLNRSLLTYTNVFIGLVDKMFIDLICNTQHIPLLAKISYHCQLLKTEHLAYWVMWCVEDYRLGFRVELGGQLSRVKQPVT